MTTVNLVQSFDTQFDINNYPYSYSYDHVNNKLTEDEGYSVEEFYISTNTFVLTYRDQDTFDYINSNYIANNWYNIEPISDELWYALFDGIYSATRSDVYMYSDMFTITFIQYNQAESNSLAWDYAGMWDPETDIEDFTRSAFKLLITTVTK